LKRFAPSSLPPCDTPGPLARPCHLASHRRCHLASHRRCHLASHQRCHLASAMPSRIASHCIASHRLLLGWPWTHAGASVPFENAVAWVALRIGLAQRTPRGIRVCPGPRPREDEGRRRAVLCTPPPVCAQARGPRFGGNRSGVGTAAGSEPQRGGNRILGSDSHLGWILQHQRRDALSWCGFLI